MTPAARSRMFRAGDDPQPDDAAARLREIGAALQDVIEGLALVDAAALGEEGRRQLQRARAAGRAAARIVGALPAEAGGAVDLVEVLNDLDDRWGGHAGARGTTLALTIAPDVPRQVALDRLALDRALSNLLSAAIAGARGGSVRLSVDCAAETLDFAVAASGRADAAPAAPSAALSVAKAMAAKLGGRIDTGTAPGVGFGATLALPRLVWNLPGDGLPDRALEGLRLRLADPGADAAVALAEIVLRHGGTVLAEDAGGTAPLTVVVADGPAGITALAETRSTARGAVLALSGDLLSTRRAELAAAGADAVLALPLPAADVVVEALLAVRRGSAPDDEGFDPEKLLRLLDLAGPEVAGELLDRLDEDLETVDAVLSDAAPARDVPALRAQTHVLISLAGAVGAERLQHLAEDLNAAAHAGNEDAIDRLWSAAAPLLARLRAHVADVRAERGAAA